MSEELRRKLRHRRHISEGDQCSPEQITLARHEISELEDTSETAEVEVEKDAGLSCRDTRQADRHGLDTKRQSSVTDELGSKLRRQLQLAEGDQGDMCFEARAQPSGSGSRSGSDRPIAGASENPELSGHTEYYSLDATDSPRASPPNSPKSDARRQTFCGAMATMLIVLAACMTTLIGVPAWVSQSQAWYGVQLYSDMRLRNIMSSVIEWSFSRDLAAPMRDEASAGSRESDTAMESLRPTGNMVARELPPVGGNPECWHGGFTWEICCSPELGPDGNEHCWDGVYTFHHCCLGAGDLHAALAARP